MLQQVMTEPGKIIFREIPVPEIGDGQVLVKRLKHYNLSTIFQKGAQTQAPQKTGFSKRRGGCIIQVALGVTR